MIRIILYLSTVLMIGYLALIYPKKVVIALFVTIILFFFPALFYGIYLSRKVKIEVRIPLPLTERKQSTEVHILVDNCGNIPLLRAKLDLAVKNHYYKKTVKKKIRLQVNKKDAASSIFNLSSNNCGRLSVSIKNFFVGDLLGIFYFPVKIEKKNLYIDVLPDIEPMNLDIDKNFWNIMGDSDFYDLNKAGDDPSEVFQIREYRKGDHIKNVYWKLTSRSEELMIKEFSRPVLCPAVLFLDMMDKNSPGEFLNADNYLEKVLAVSSGLLEKDCFHMVVYYDAVSDCIQRVKIEKEDHIYELTDHLFQILPYEKDIDLEEIYHLEYPQHEYSISYLLNMNMELWEGGGFSCGREKKLL